MKFMSKTKSKKTILPETGKVIVKDSKLLKNQLGVIAKKNFRKSDLLFVVKGPVKSKPTKYSFSIGLNKHIEPKRNNGSSDIGHYLNHSCNPNSIIKIINNGAKTPYIKVLARRNIKAGEELTFDYASLEYDITADKTKCGCKEKNCRKIMHGFKDLSTNIVERYKREGIIPEYLLKIKR